jgi:hypothetical protein
MNQSELKEILERKQERMKHHGYAIEQDRQDDLTLLAFLQQYLDIKEPEEKNLGIIRRDGLDIFNEGFNEALHLAKLAQMKKLEGITPEQLHEWYMEAVLDLDGGFNELANIPYEQLTEAQQYIDKFIADKLRQHMGGK